MFPQILDRLIASGRSFTWTIVGDGPELKPLRQAMVSPSAERKVLFTGQVSYRRVPELLADSDVFLLTSEYEGLPLSLLEALALGVVPVVSDLDTGVRESIEPGTGIFIRLDDLDGYASGILQLDSDRGLLTKMSLAAEDLARRKFSCSAMADRWIRMFSEFPCYPAVWDPNPRIKRAIGMRLLGLGFLPLFRPVGDCIDYLRGWRF